MSAEKCLKEALMVRDILSYRVVNLFVMDFFNYFDKIRRSFIEKKIKKRIML